MNSGNNEKILGGFYLKARCIRNSEIAIAPPHVREIWDWLIGKANHRDRKIQGTLIKRGQCLTTYNDILEGLKWKIGYRYDRYSKNHCETAMKWLTKHTMIHTAKTTRGIIVTIFNYDKYQNPKNYETYSETYTGSYNEHTVSRHDKQELKNEKKSNKEKKYKTAINTPTVINRDISKPYIPSESEDACMEDPKHQHMNRAGLQTSDTGIDAAFKEISLIISGFEKCIEKDSYILVNKIVRELEYDRIKVWAAIIQSRSKRNPPGYLCKILVDPNWAPSDSAYEKAKREMRKYDG